MKFKGYIRFVLIPLLLLSAAGLSLYQVFGGNEDFTPVYFSLMAGFGVLGLLALLNERDLFQASEKSPRQRQWELGFRQFRLGYYHPNRRQLDPGKLRKAAALLSRGQLEPRDDQRVRYMEWHDGPGAMAYSYAIDLERLGLAVRIPDSISPEELVQKTETVLYNKGFPHTPLTAEAITARDSRRIRNRRKKGRSTAENDLKILGALLQAQDLIPALCFGECFTVLTAQEEEALRELENA